MVVEKHIRAHDFLRGGPKWVVIYGTGGEFNTGYVWAPYIMGTDTAIDELPPSINTLNISTRYLKILNTMNNGYYSTMTL